MAAKRGRVFTFEPVGLDRFDPKPHHPEPGTRVVLTQPYGAPKNGTMGFVYVQDAESGDFYGLVLKNSLKATGDMAIVRDKAAEARDARSAALYSGRR
jgi:hypothetical protein